MVTLCGIRQKTNRVYHYFESDIQELADKIDNGLQLFVLMLSDAKKGPEVNPTQVIGIVTRLYQDNGEWKIDIRSVPKGGILDILESVAEQTGDRSGWCFTFSTVGEIIDDTVVEHLVQNPHFISITFWFSDEPMMVK